jgi:hypothetical protein
MVMANPVLATAGLTCRVAQIILVHQPCKAGFESYLGLVLHPPSTAETPLTGSNDATLG